MSASWAQGGQPPPGGKPNHGNRPPICFNCSREGHFMVACPEPPRQAPNSFAPPAPQYQSYPGPAPPPQAFPPQVGPVQTPYQNYPPTQQYGPPVPQYSHPQMPVHQNYPTTAQPQYGSHGNQQPPYNAYSGPSGPPPYTDPAQQPNGPPQYGPPQPANPYNQPTNMYPPYPQNAPYGGNYGPRNYQPPSQQWNNAPSVPQPSSATSYQHQQRAYSESGYHSATPGFHAHSHQPRQEGHNPQSFQQSPRTPASNAGSIQQPISHAPQAAAPAPGPQSKNSSRANTPYGQPGSAPSSVPNEAAGGPVSPAINDGKGSTQQQDDQDELDVDEQFNWALECIFKQPPIPETVALAQPLSTNFGMTPVPLLDKKSPVSISRYARKDNLKEFIRDIRNAPQWSFLKEDPAFSDINLDAPLIPLDDIPAWIAARHGMTEDVEDDLEMSRKRARSDEIGDGPEDVQMDAGNDTAPEVTPEVEDVGPPSKRWKGEEGEKQLEPGPDTSATPVVTTPVLAARVGTPCVAVDDDVWAPQPGEGAAPAEPIQDPTEALLASLGVTGAPKPVIKDPAPPYKAPSEERIHPPNSGPNFPSTRQHVDQAPSSDFPNNPPINRSYDNAPVQQPQFGPPSNPPYSNHPPQHGPANHHPYANHPQYQPQSLPPNLQYQHGAPHTSHGDPQYGPPNFSQYPPQQGNHPYGPPTHHPPYNGPVMNGAYGVAPPNRAPQYGPGQPQNNTYNPQPYKQHPNYGSAQMNGYGSGVHGNYGNGQPSQQPYGANVQSSPPSRQDSGYMSAGGSYVNGSGRNGFENHQTPPGEGSPKYGYSQAPDPPAEGMSRSNSNTGDQDGSPLSPMSQEILGKLSQPGGKFGTGKKADQAEDVRKLKRPAPVVAEAYSRRW